MYLRRHAKKGFGMGANSGGRARGVDPLCTNKLEFSFLLFHQQSEINNMCQLHQQTIQEMCPHIQRFFTRNPYELKYNITSTPSHLIENMEGTEIPIAYTKVLKKKLKRHT